MTTDATTNPTTAPATTDDIPQHIIQMLGVAKTYAVLVAAMAAPFLKGRTNVAVQVAATGFDIALQAIEQQADIDNVSWASLNADEALIVADNAAAEADEIKRRASGQE